MKKIFALMTVATLFVACGGGEQAPAAVETVPPVVDTTKKDTAATAPVAPAAEPAKAETKGEAKKH